MNNCLRSLDIITSIFNYSNSRKLDAFTNHRKGEICTSSFQTILFADCKYYLISEEILKSQAENTNNSPKLKKYYAVKHKKHAMSQPIARHFKVRILTLYGPNYFFRRFSGHNLG